MEKEGPVGSAADRSAKRDRRQGQPQMVTCPFSELEELVHRPESSVITLLQPAVSLVFVLVVF